MERDCAPGVPPPFRYIAAPARTACTPPRLCIAALLLLPALFMWLSSLWLEECDCIPTPEPPDATMQCSQTTCAGRLAPHAHAAPGLRPKLLLLLLFLLRLLSGVCLLWRWLLLLLPPLAATTLCYYLSWEQGLTDICTLSPLSARPALLWGRRRRYPDAGPGATCTLPPKALCGAGIRRVLLALLLLLLLLLRRRQRILLWPLPAAAAGRGTLLTTSPSPSEAGRSVCWWGEPAAALVPRLAPAALCRRGRFAGR